MEIFDCFSEDAYWGPMLGFYCVLKLFMPLLHLRSWHLENIFSSCIFYVILTSFDMQTIQVLNLWDYLSSVFIFDALTWQSNFACKNYSPGCQKQNKQKKKSKRIFFIFTISKFNSLFKFWSTWLIIPIFLLDMCYKVILVNYKHGYCRSLALEVTWL